MDIHINEICKIVDMVIIWKDFKINQKLGNLNKLCKYQLVQDIEINKIIPIVQYLVSEHLGKDYGFRPQIQQFYRFLIWWVISLAHYSAFQAISHVGA